MDIFQILVSFCAGVFGTLVGALNLFILFGLVLLFGVLGVVVSAGTSTVLFDWISVLAFGSYFSPFIAFLGGAIAAMYAGSKGYIKDGKQIDLPLITLGKSDVYLVGGLSGVVGYLCSYFIVNPYLGDKVDGGAFIIALVSILGKYIFTGTILGSVPKYDQDLGGRLSSKVTNVWQLCQRQASDKVWLGFAVGGVASMAAYSFFQAGVDSYVAAYFGFAIATVSLFFLHLGIPVTHHIALCGGYATVAVLLNVPEVSIATCLAWGIVFSIMATWLGDVLGSVFHVYGIAHIDPPALSITVTSLTIMYIFPMIKVLHTDNPLIPSIIIILFIGYAFYATIKNKQQA